MDLFARTSQALDWTFLAAALSRHTRTAAGRRAAQELEFSTQAEAIASCFDAIDEIARLKEAGSGAPPLAGIEDIGAAIEAARGGEVLELEDLAITRASLGTLARLAAFLETVGQTAPTLAALGEPLALEAMLYTTFELALDERGHLSERAYPKLGELRGKMEALERRMRSTLERLLDSSEYADVLQDRYVSQREGRFVLPIKAQAKALGLGIVHDASRTKQTVFLEPAAVVPMGNEWRMAAFDLRSEELRIRSELSALLGRNARALGAALEAATQIDLASARAAFAVQLGAVRPELGNEGVVRLIAARHPVLALSSEPVVANDLALDQAKPVLVLTGPNAGGKTVAMKTVGLCALLVRAGCFVPAAAGSRVDLFPNVVADIGDQQTVHEGLSSFSGHLATLQAMLKEAGPNSLVLLDEIAAGTDPTQGGALARALVERFADVGARIVTTTHYAQLKAMPAADSRVAMAALEYREGQPTYRLVPGMAGESHALAAAERAGIDDKLVSRARDLMGDAERALQEALAAVESEREQAARSLAEAETKTAELEQREQAILTREIKIKRHARELERKEAAAFVERLEAADKTVSQALEALKANPSQAVAAAARSTIRESRRAALPAEQPKAASSKRKILLGDRVKVAGIGAVGDVVAIRGREFEIRAGAMVFKVSEDKLEYLGKAQHAQRAAEIASRPRSMRSRGKSPNRYQAGESGASGDATEFAMRTVDNTLDLRGVRVEEGLAKLESFLDASMLASRDAIFVLHGHGTGAMKEAVRKWLRSSPYVEHSEAAAEEQGGDALTVATLS